MPLLTAFDAAAALLESSRRERVFPAWAAEAGSATRALWQAHAGRLTFAADAPATTSSTLFDLASLTKPLATTSVILDLVEQQRLRLDTRVSDWIPDWQGLDRDAVTVRDLLEHAGGLSARLLEPPPGEPRGFEHDIATMPLEYMPRSRALYSDLGFILLGFIAERAGGERFEPLVERVLSIGLHHDADPAHDEQLRTRLAPHERPLAAPTTAMPEDVRSGRRLQGVVHDNYAALLGGLAGHAGLFGTAAGVGRLARLLLRAARGGVTGRGVFGMDTVRLAITKSRVPGSSRALGWDTMLPTSSCGTRLSASAFGHVGFTGTSLWIDPEQDRYYVLLTNRVCDGGSSDDMQRVRRAFHDTLAGA